MLSDLELVYLWHQFSDEYYGMGWTDVVPGTQKQFQDWLNGRLIGGQERKLDSFEWEGLSAIREAYHSRLIELDGKSLSPALRTCQKPQALKESLKAKAISVAAAIRDGTATSGLVRSFLQEDIPPLDSEYPLPNARETGSNEELAAEFKAASAFAIIKGIGALMSDDPDTAGDAVNEYLELRHCAEEASLAWAIISPPSGQAPLNPAFRDAPVELYRMTCLNSIEDPIMRRHTLLRFLRQDWKAGLIVKRDSPEWHYR